MKVFVISLPHVTDRRIKMKQQLDALNIDFEFFDGIYGKDFYDNPQFMDVEKSIRYERRKLNPGELGCALSHLGIYKKIIEQNLPHAFILEDDALISSDVPQIMQIIPHYIKPKDLITLERCDLYYPFGQTTLFKQYKLVKPYMVKYGSMCQAAGYIITKEAAEYILKTNFPVFIPADSWGHYRFNVNYRGVIPTQTLIRQNMEFDSNIVTGIRNTQGRKKAWSLLFYAFYTRLSFGIFLKEKYKQLRRHFTEK